MRGSVDKRRNRYGSPIEEWNPALEGAQQRLLRAEPYLLGPSERELVLNVIQDVCRHRNWQLLAAHVRATHVHVVASGAATPEAMLQTFKAYATRNLSYRDGAKRPRWAGHGSTLYLWSPKAIAAACDYVVNHQGAPMSVFTDRRQPVTNAPGTTPGFRTRA